MIVEDNIAIVDARQISVSTWLHLRQAIWPKDSADVHRQEIEALLRDTSASIAFVALLPAQEAVGFAEARLRHDYVNGCESSPVAFLEGIYVTPDYRRRGFARLLSRAVEEWGRAKGCSEFASDTELANSAGVSLHLSLGFAETERVIFFRKLLTDTKQRVPDR